MKFQLNKYLLLNIVLINIILIGTIFSGFELYLWYFTEEEPVEWRVTQFCNEARKNNYMLVDRTKYLNDDDGIYKYGKEGKSVFFPGKYNSSGFTGNDLVPSNTDQPTILFIGDSHTFGVAARPLQEKRFESRVKSAGYYTWNTGIGGLDVVQYGLIANKYIPELMPDYVVLMLFLGNDINRPPSPVAPGKHLHFQTNIGGWVQGYDKFGYSFSSAFEAVDYRLIQQCGASLNATLRIYLRSRLFQKMYLFYYDYIKSFPKSVATNNENEWIADTLAEISSHAEKHKSEFILFVIPEKDNLTMNEIEGEILFLRKREFDPVYPGNLKRYDYEARGGHMLNSGHRKYADFILEKLISAE